MNESICKHILFVLVLITGVSCSDNESLLENKWQLRQEQRADGTTEHVDSVFYNFMKGSFSAICLLPDKSYSSIFGNYSLAGDSLRIIILPDYALGEVYRKYLNWEERRRTFHVDELTSSTLQLSYNNKISIFRRY